MDKSTLVDGVKVTTLTTGAGPMVLASAVTGFRGVSALTDQAFYSYAISQPTGEYEFGQGQYTLSTSTLTRNVYWSSNSNAAIALTGQAVVSFTVFAEDLTEVEETTAPVQTNGFTLSDEFDWWPIDATAGNITFTIPEGTSNINMRTNVVRVDNTSNTVTFAVTGSDELLGFTPGSALLVGAGSSKGIKNLSTVDSGQAWVAI